MNPLRQFALSDIDVSTATVVSHLARGMVVGRRSLDWSELSADLVTTSSTGVFLESDSFVREVWERLKRAGRVGELRVAATEVEEIAKGVFGRAIEGKPEGAEEVDSFGDPRAVVRIRLVGLDRQGFRAARQAFDREVAEKIPAERRTGLVTLPYLG